MKSRRFLKLSKSVKRHSNQIKAATLTANKVNPNIPKRRHHKIGGNNQIKKKKKVHRTVKTYPNTPIGYGDDALMKLKHRVYLAEITKPANTLVVDVNRDVTSKSHRFIPLPCRKYKFDTLHECYTRPTVNCCYWCTEPFATIPYPMPYRLDPKTKMFSVNGFYCSVNCLLADAFAKNLKLICICRTMLSIVYGICATKIIERAPTRLVLKKYGGIMDIESFRATSIIGIKSNLISLPFAPFEMGIEELERVTTTIYESGITCDDNFITRIQSGPIGGLKQRVVDTNDSFVSISNRSPISITKKNANSISGPFATIPSIDDQIKASEQKLRLQRTEFNQSKKPKNTKNTIKYYLAR
jgi:hypothetical protein